MSRRKLQMCPQAKRTESMIYCKSAQDLCGHQRFCVTKGIYMHTDAAGQCPLRGKREDNACKDK